MNGAAIAEIADKRNGEVINVLLEVDDSEEVKQRLAGMLADAIAAADNNWRTTQVFAEPVKVVGCFIGGADFGMAQDNQVGVAADGAHCIGKVFAFVDG